ncbi:MAG: nucleotidyl transferase AbiEii/AbiGii toxin family protein [Patescibacteria group bacterium]|nr:nucleotidyl transferase AbiEii/AbiGii toxin family protein [Patescibacteria group bacterium]
MIQIRQEDILHKVQLQKLLIAVVDNSVLSQNTYFKGGTCAAMLGFLDRFSIDLDFDLKKGSNRDELRKEFKKIFKSLDLTIGNNNEKTLLFTLKYMAPQGLRNTLKLSVYEDIFKSNDYKTIYLQEIDRLVNCQTIETMFANKLVAPIDRYNKHQKIAGRDIYDIHYFFSQGYKFKKEIIEERMNIDVKKFIGNLIDFIENNFNEKILTEDLSTLLPYKKFNKIRKVLKQETLMFLRSC